MILVKLYLQIACVVAIAVGGGLYVYGDVLDTKKVIGTMTRATGDGQSDPAWDHQYFAATMSGLGTCLTILGVLGLGAMWVRNVRATAPGDLGDNLSRTIATIALWFSVSAMFTYGVSRISWSQTPGMYVLLFVVAMICLTANASTAMIFGWRPWNRTDRGVSPNRREQA